MLYVFGICVAGAILFVAVNNIEPDRRYASVLKLLIVLGSAKAIARRCPNRQLASLSRMLSPSSIYN